MAITDFPVINVFYFVVDNSTMEPVCIILRGEGGYAHYFGAPLECLSQFLKTYTRQNLKGCNHLVMLLAVIMQP